MANWIWRSKKENEQGFSLVELLIVVIIMGILAAIAIPLFLSQRAKAEDAKTQGLVETMGKELSTWWTDATKGPVIAVVTTGSTPGFHLYSQEDAGGSTFAASKETLVTPTPTGMPFPAAAVTVAGLSSGTGSPTPAAWGFSGTDKTDWCFFAWDTDGKTKGYVVDATRGLRAISPVSTTAPASNVCPVS
jgi:prepilin-type N-terminal cleavage/methylation domain-containing protein